MNQLYYLTFDYSGNPTGTTANETANVSINGTVVTNVVSIYNPTNTWSNIKWSTVSVPYRATSTNTLLDFDATSAGSGGVLLDAVSLIANNTVKTVWENGFEGYPNYNLFGAGQAGGNYIDGWLVNPGNVEIRSAGQSFGSVPYEGGDYLDLNGLVPGTISTNIPTVVGQEYILNFAYTRNPNSVTGTGSPAVVPQVAVLINNNQIADIIASSTNTWTPLDWQIATLTFKATSSSTLLTFQSTNTPGPSGVFLDYVTLSTNVSSLDSLDFENVSNVVADHVSAEWSYNNLVSVLNSSNVTVQWSILSDSLYVTNNPAPMGSLLRFGNGALSFNHDLYADNYTGNPRLGDNLSLDYVNNVVYDWGTNAGFSTNDSALGGFTNNLNYDCNYIIAGSNSLPNNIAFFGGTPNTWIYQTNNVIDSNTNGILDGADTQWAMFTNQFTKVGQPFPLIPVPTDEAYLAYEKDLDFAGVDLDKRDPADTNIVSNVRQQTGTLISSPSVLIPGDIGLPYLDTDQDGLPDFWEITFGQPPYVPSNNTASTNVNYLGYTTLEEYENWLAAPHALTITNTPVGVDLQQLFGESGHLSFFVTNVVNGSVNLTNVIGSVTNTGPYSNSIAVFTPTNNRVPQPITAATPPLMSTSRIPTPSPTSAP